MLGKLTGVMAGRCGGGRPSGADGSTEGVPLHFDLDGYSLGVMAWR